MLIAEKTSQWDLNNELSKAGVRWLLALGVGAYLFAQVALGNTAGAVAGTLNYSYVGTLILLTILLNLGLHLFLLRRRRKGGGISRKFKYASMVFDLLMVSALLLPTGGRDSMFFLVYFVIILSNGIRYGMRLSVIALILFNTFYVGVLFLQTYPGLQLPEFSREALKVIGVWFVGIYTGYLSRRFELLQNEVENYRQIIRRMTEGQDNG